jgi:hypothetical protein
MTAACSNDFNEIRRHPYLDLLEPNLGSFFELDEELPSLEIGGDIDKHPNQVVPKSLVLLLPHAADYLCFTRNRTELISEFKKRVRNELLGNRLTVIKPQGQEDFEPPECSAHISPDPRR